MQLKHTIFYFTLTASALVASIDLSMAQDTTTSTTEEAKTENAEVKKEEEKKTPNDFGLILSSNLNSNRRSSSDPDRERSIDITVNPIYRYSPKTSIVAVIAGTKDLVGERLWTWEDSYLGGSRLLIETGEDIKISGLARIYHPTSEASKDLATLRTKLFLAPQIVVGPKTIKKLPLTVYYRPSGTVSFHRYKVGLNGKSNNQYSLSHRLILVFELNEKWSVTLDNIYGRSWTYQSNTKDNYSLDYSAGYALRENLSLNLGYSIGGNPLKANGRESSIDLYDDSKSTFYIGLEYTI